ncbi:hypothetical protein EDB84DRAFT_118412 [Lactarius hengduanensis]|nr:hypothetical protein EDB84DRAFT_118412 [Lactarius hengduanensis]
MTARSSAGRPRRLCHRIQLRLARRARRVPTHRRDFTHLLLQISIFLPVIIVQRERPRGAGDRRRIAVDAPPPLHTLPPSPRRLRPAVPAASNRVGAASPIPTDLCATHIARVPVLPPAMAYNGVLEAFLASVCTPADLRAQSRMMAAASAALIATALSRCTRVRRRRRGTRVGQHGKHGRARAVRLALRTQVLRGPRRAPPPTRDRARARARRAAPSARRARSVCGCRSVHALERRCACRCPVVAVGVALGGACLGACLVVCYVLERRRFLRTIAVLRRSRK